jgi:glycyl-tRNA synthetase beta chain
MNTLLLEIGTEEIPAGYIAPALKALSSMLLQKMDEARIDHGEARTYGTPRRMALKVADVADKQETVTTEVMGPPKNVGYDQKGRPTVAAQKFAEKVGVAISQVKIKETPKGPYLYVKKTKRGVTSQSLLKTILPEVITATPFPKTMKWADLDLHFARPIQSITALLGERVISFTLGNIKSGRYTFGHCFMDPGKIKIDHPSQYVDKLKSAHVLVDTDERKALVEREIEAAADQVGGRVLTDRELVDIVTNLIEYPAVVLVHMDETFLELPREVLITAMREHQRYFAVIDEKGDLKPYFIAVNNTRAKDMALVAKGHERVLKARLEDARFFYHADLEASLDQWVNELKGVLFQAALGSVYEKVLRIQNIAEFLTERVADASDLRDAILRAAFLCKADLVSQVVVEFPKLQGVMGRIYANAAGESETVAFAIEEHYRPLHSGGSLPDTTTGALLAIADKIDSICGCFSVGLIPTGASDPYALRRQGIGILQIMLARGFDFSLRTLIAESIKPFAEKTAAQSQDAGENVYRFLKSRMAHLLEEDGFSKDVIAAVLSVSADRVPDVWNRARALENLKFEPDFEPLATAFKRVVNIIKKSDYGAESAAVDRVDESLFKHESESNLYGAFRNVQEKVAENVRKGFFDQALLEIASLRTPVDAFFDGVMVMTDDLKLRENRFALLGHIAALFDDIADFSKLST